MLAALAETIALFFPPSNPPLLVIRSTQQVTPVSVATLHGYIILTSHHETGEGTLGRPGGTTNNIQFRGSAFVPKYVLPANGIKHTLVLLETV